jgi:hypothetical protein
MRNQQEDIWLKLMDWGDVKKSKKYSMGVTRQNVHCTKLVIHEKLDTSNKEMLEWLSNYLLLLSAVIDIDYIWV